VTAGEVLRRLRPYVGLLIVLLLAAWAWPRREQLAAAFRDLGGSLLPSAAVLVVGLVLAVATWQAALAAVGTRFGVRESAAVYLPAQLGKYLPGALWPVLGQADRAGDFGASRRSVAVGGALALLVAALTAATVGVFAIAPLGGVALIVSVACAVALTVTLLLAPGPVLRAGARVLPGWAGTVTPDAAALRRALAWGWATWLVQGLHLLPLLLASGVGWRAALVPAVCGYAAAWLAGLVAVFAPAGAGVREAALVVALSGVVDAPTAFAIALASRALTIFVDLIGAAVGVRLARRARSRRA
jgi:hypothetical protein